MRHVQPGPTRVLVSSSATMQGPGTEAPGLDSLRLVQGLRMVPVLRADGAFHARVVAARLGSEGIVTQLRGNGRRAFRRLEDDEVAELLG